MPARPHRRWLRIVGWSTLALSACFLLALTIAWWQLDALLTWQVRQQLASRLLPSATLDALSVSPLSGELTLAGLRIAQPDGFGGGTFCELGEIHLALAPRSLFTSDIAVSALRIADLTVHVIRRTDGAFDLEQIVRPSSASASAPAVPQTAVSTVSAAPPSPWRCRIETLRIERVTLVIDDQVAGRTWISALRGLDLAVDGLALDLSPSFALGVQHAVLRLASGNLQQASVTGPGDLVALRALRVELAALPALAAPLTVTSATLGDLSGRWQREQDGDDNLDQTLTQLSAFADAAVTRLRGPAAAPATPTAAPTGVAEQTAGPAAKPFVLDVQHLAVMDGRFTYRDATLAEEPLALELSGLHLDVRDLRVNPPAASGPNARFALGCRAAQPAADAAATGPAGAELPPGTQPALIDVVGESRPLGDGIPTLALRAEISGLLLDTVGPLLPSGTRTALGGAALDAQASLRLAPDVLDLAGLLRNEQGTAFPFAVRGTPAAPEVDLGPIMSAALNRLGGSLAHVGTATFGVGKEIVGSGAAAVGSLGKGAVKLGSKIGGGLFSVVKGIVTLDAGEVGDGLHKATVGSAKSTLKTITKTGLALGDGASGSLDAVSGSQGLPAWRDATGQRHAAALAEAVAWLAQAAPH